MKKRIEYDYGEENESNMILIKPRSNLGWTENRTNAILISKKKNKPDLFFIGNRAILNSFKNQSKIQFR